MSQIRDGRAQLQIGGNTTLQDAQAFLAKAGHDGKKVYGKTDAATGVTTLYLKTGTKLSELLKPGGRERAEQKQAAGRAGLQKIVDQHVQRHEARGLSQTGQAANKAIFMPVRDALSGSGSLQVGSAKQIIAQHAVLEQLATTIPTTALPPAQPAPSGPTLSSLNTASTASILDGAAKRIRLNNDDAGAADSLAVELVKGAKINNPRRAEQALVAMSDQSQLKREIVSELKTRLDTSGGSQPAARLEAIATDALQKANASLLGATAGGGTQSVDIQGVAVELPNEIRTGGETLTLGESFAEGGFGTLFKLDGGAEPKAFKVLSPKVGLEAAVASSIAEVRSHLLAQGDGHANVVKLEAVVPLSNGSFGIVLSMAEHGSLDDVFRKGIHGAGRIADQGTAPATGQITQAEMEIVTLTVAADILSGLDHMHRTQGVIHFDEKVQNVLLEGDGNAVLADFGTTFDAAQTTLLSTPEILQPIYKAPEFVKADEDIRVLDQTTANNLSTLVQAAQLPNETEVIDRVTASVVEDARSQIVMDQKVDVWGLGATIATLASGKDLLSQYGNFNIAKENALIAFTTSNNIPGVAMPGVDGKLPQGALGYASGMQAVDNLTNRILQPTPGGRPDVGALLNDPALALPGVGSREAKALLSALASGDNGRIDSARAALAQSLQPVAANPAPVVAPPLAPPSLPTFRTSVDLSASSVAFTGAPSLKSQVDDFMYALRSGNQSAIQTAAAALDQGIEENKGPAPQPPVNG